ncbi:hypothetical protein J6590_050324 [Homalodisca vitripennis]|nr:hypothetical protein J6590_050324 [Homalodisca vitripennis]
MEGHGPPPPTFSLTLACARTSVLRAAPYNRHHRVRSYRLYRDFFVNHADTEPNSVRIDLC